MSSSRTKPIALAITGLTVVACLAASGCGDAASDDTGQRAETTTKPIAEPLPPLGEQRQSRAERRLAARAFKLQRARVRGDYETICAQLSERTTVTALGFPAGSCPAELAKRARQGDDKLPRIAWVRLRGEWGNVIVRRSGGLALSPISHENGRWRYYDLELLGIEWPPPVPQN